ncbi:hypothetical protein [Enemella dayhoffiae]|uniref:hypothetical protein n=1 Tax=Enemella dayhoffiae TaxID=2016507 RepID=UPI001140671A|nr:hypothetical protein [Enemella dayhoffiae]
MTDHARHALQMHTSEDTAALIYTGLAIADAINRLADVLTQPDADPESTPITCSGVLDLDHKLRCPMPHPLTEAELNQWTRAMPDLADQNGHTWHYMDTRGGVTDWTNAQGDRLDSDQLVDRHSPLHAQRGDR